MLFRGQFGGDAAFFLRDRFGHVALLVSHCGCRIRLMAAAANFDPDVVAAARGYDVEAIVSHIRQPMLHGAKLLERDQRLSGQQLRHHADGGVERELVCRDMERALADYNVRLLADVHHQRVAIGANNCGKK